MYIYIPYYIHIPNNLSYRIILKVWFQNNYFTILHMTISFEDNKVIIYLTVILKQRFLKLKIIYFFTTQINK